MKMSLALAAALLAACNTASSELLPPPFGPNGRQPVRLFFPTGLAVAPDGTLLVANGNFNHAFDAGTVASIRKSYLDKLFSARSEEHTSELQSHVNLVCRLLLEKKKKK